MDCTCLRGEERAESREVCNLADTGHKRSQGRKLKLDTFSLEVRMEINHRSDSPGMWQSLYALGGLCFQPGCFSTMYSPAPAGVLGWLRDFLADSLRSA